MCVWMGWCVCGVRVTGVLRCVCGERGKEWVGV